MICENCEKDHDGVYGSGRFCGTKCARGFSTKLNRDITNQKVSAKMSGRKLSADHVRHIEEGNNFNRKAKTIKQCINCRVDIVCLEHTADRRKFCTSKCRSTYTEKNKEPFLLYRQRCNFDFKIDDYPGKFDLVLVEQHGWYSPSNKGNNLDGASRDHMFSVKHGFAAGVSPDIIKHPANCNIILHRQNQSKREKSSITLEELLERIKNWHS
jgi:hypothetical protein